MQAEVPQAKGNTGLVGGAISAITAHIRDGELSPGDKLPSESVFARDLAVSRTVVREAFRSLAAMRLIEVSTGKRATVAKLDHTAISPLIEHGVSTEQISILQVYDVRRTIETRTATLAALHRTGAQSREIAALAETMQNSFLDPAAMMEADIGFHLAIARAAKNPIYPLIVGAFEGVTRQTWPVGWKSRSSESEQHHMLDIHSDLASAIAAGNPEQAAELMALHFDASVRALLAAGIS
ncbi:FadR/GntR family transcriptional regulator [Oceanomicrobium pacificus]|uniref:FadR/GntR family transcriptional regulator n=1 Tax=Oceanomicrobium pacificus TaxID=2692916 RepID=UPI0019675D85|nr:FadR/GntR family transcriptional regulator [Oceanomicrobium pacificus]